MSGASKDNKQIAKALEVALGGGVKFSRYHDQKDVSYIDIVSSRERPFEGVNSFSTIGLSDYPLIKNGQEFKVRIEIIGAAYSVFVDFPNMITAAAFCVINDQWFFGPGVILRDVVSMYDDSLEMKHFLFVPPLFWEALEVMRLESKKVAWLMVVPISERESIYAEENGSEALEDLLGDAQINCFDLRRKSIL